MNLEVKVGDIIRGRLTTDEYKVILTDLKTGYAHSRTLICRVSDGVHFLSLLDKNNYMKVPKIEKKEFWQILYQTHTPAIVKGLMIAVDHKPTEKAVRDYLDGDKILKIEKVTVEYEVVD